MRAQTSTPVNEIIATRRSPRSFNATAELSDGDLLAMLEAARWAPSAFNAVNHGDILWVSAEALSSERFSLH